MYILDRFHQIGQGTSLSPAQVRKYAQHFIFWRRAIAIPPLHARDVYVLSPNSDMSRLPRASQAWARAFPLAPPLPEFLAALSAAPRAYKLFAPSKNHRPTYLAMLAWLMRGGWVTQLCSFAYVVVWPEILYEVDYELEAEELRAAQQHDEDARAEADATSSSSAPDSESSQASSSPPPPSSSADVHQQQQQQQSPLSPGTTAASTSASLGTHSPTGVPASMTSSTATLRSPPLTTSSTSTLTTVPTTATTASTTATAGEQAAEQARLDRLATRAHREAAEKAAAHARRPPPRATPHPSVNDAPHLAHLSPYVIVDAGRVGERESRYLSAIGRRLPERVATAAATAAGGGGGSSSGGARLGGGKAPAANLNPRAAWPVFWKYFNGRCPLERVALHEDMKRRDAWNLLNSMSEYLLCVRHW